MAKLSIRRKAIKLREKGWTYSEIKDRLGLSKSTLSTWLNDYPLTNKQIVLLEKRRSKNKYLSIEKIRNTKQAKREKRLRELYRIEKEHLLPINNRELYISGLMLYWGEGRKNLNSSVSLSNTDPQVVKFFVHWLIQSLGVSLNHMRAVVHLYSDMNVEKTLAYWSKTLGIPRNQFIKPYIKQSTRAAIDHKGYGHGTCGVYVYDARLKERILAGIESIASLSEERLTRVNLI